MFQAKNENVSNLNFKCSRTIFSRQPMFQAKNENVSNFFVMHVDLINAKCFRFLVLPIHVVAVASTCFKGKL
jgi:hypothetical protein